ncbi:hypothetical protein QBC46DRAFT_387999 [Diplogelasinospora grovesii]|uniref:RNA-binding protein n=1 Tax=Diplogelasinospora grovesii TaxID=303347 RepID=A0AAN6N6U3_9PEZI|nr:hypothetical protein QBC46DRAFT_387999 [Diplogelasinospora grovesii]
MYEGYQSGFRDGAEDGYTGGFRRRDDDDRDGEYNRSRKDPSGPIGSLNYDENDDGGDGHFEDRAQYRGQHSDPSEIPNAGYNYGGSFRGGYGRGNNSQNARDEGGYARGHGRPHSPPRGPIDSGRYSGNSREPVSARRSFGTSGRALFLGDIPDDATERDILSGLDYVSGDPNMSTDQVRFARLRYDHDGRRVAVVEFHRRADAEYFLDKHHPEISFPLKHTRGIDSKPVTVGIGSGNNRDETDYGEQRGAGADWQCTECGASNYPDRNFCYKCKVERHDYGPHRGDAVQLGASGGFRLTGETDECPQQLPSHYLVIRNLGGSTTEEVLAKGVGKLLDNSEAAEEAANPTAKLKSTAPANNKQMAGARPGTLRRVFLMRDRRTNQSWRYGFAEFATVEDAVAAIAKFHGSAKFTIASKPVSVAFVHTGVFVPSLDNSSDSEQFLFAPIYNPALRLKYWDDRAYPSVLVVSDEPLSRHSTPEASGKVDDAAAATKSINPARHPVIKKLKRERESAADNKGPAMMPQMQMWAQKSAELHGSRPRAELDDAPTDDNTDSLVRDTSEREASEDLPPDGPRNPHWTDQYLSYADWDRVACLLCDWEVPSQEFIGDHGYSEYRREDVLIDHEVRIHNHYKDSEDKGGAAQRLIALGKEPRAIIRRTPRLRSDVLPVYRSYADFESLHCHVCRRNFKHEETLWRHEQESELHKRMLADPKNKERAVAELKSRGKAPCTMMPDEASRRQHEQQQREYRDRAELRRKVFGQPNRPLPQAAAPRGAAGAEKRKDPAAIKERVAEAIKNSKGAGMLAKMGWATGAGLGAEGAGRTEAIAPEAYAPGVGLGAEGSKLGDASEEAARRTSNNYDHFIEKTRDRARERYQQM